jgi:transcription-repair coupling factor (superfamily II helicase)
VVAGHRKAAKGDIFAAAAPVPAFKALREGAEQGRALSWAGVPFAAAAFSVVWLRLQFPTRPILVVTDTTRSQEDMLSDVNAWCGLAGVAAATCFSAWEAMPKDGRLPSLEVVGERIEALAAAAAWRAGARAAPTVIVSSTALTQQTFHPLEFAERTRRLRRGDSVNPLDLVEWLEDQGYEPEVRVSHAGEISMRGGIIDVWPLQAETPVRLEFFGDEIDSLREFDPAAQVSLDPVDEAVLPPAGEFALFRPKEGRAPRTASLLDHLGEEAIVVLWEPEASAEHARHFGGLFPEPSPLLRGWDEMLAEWRTLVRSWVAVSEHDGGGWVGFPGDTEPLGAAFESLDLWRPTAGGQVEPAVAEARRREFFRELDQWIARGRVVRVYCHSEGEVQRFGELWRENGLGAPSADALRAVVAPLSRGFLIEGAGQAVVTDAEIYGRTKTRRPRRLRGRHAARASALQVDFTEFEEGDFVVHINHGIGVFRGLAEAPAAGGGARECLAIEYAPSRPGEAAPRLYVPVSEAHLVGKYVGAGKARPQLNTLGGGRWTKAREQAARAVKDLAGELLAVQAARATLPGVSIGEDSEWQREFEASFEFEETIDQSRAIEAVKRDQESPRPMDRLLCGDVGFGKTEVALRAAFKAVMGGKQVAVLAPTTVLAQQHYNLFRERMAGYPVRVELLSRFRSPSERRAVLQAAATGGADIIIGTHGLAQPSVAFRDLGLLIVDEEQRFGVRHKEALRKLRATVDTLALSATPIPRTLYLALTGARDLSTLETPPLDRLPVETVVGDYDERVIRDAINRELSRSGQVYYVHNRVATIEAAALRLKALVPDARIVIGHGQMDDDELEEVMTRFVNGEADVLVSTTIIESGLDIPNANTMIIERADRFGLGELYQLRGRVGRYKHQAHCLLLLPRHARLLTEARRRLSAIKRYAALGSGFKIALRDLEIRGAGNILGAEQSGHITAVGFDLYCRLLQQSISTLKGERPAVRADTRISLDFLALDPGAERRPAVPKPKSDDGSCEDESDDHPGEEVVRAPACLPAGYAPEPAQRLEIYRRLAQVGEPGPLAALRAELRDRFGAEPDGVRRLFALHELRVTAAARGVDALDVAGDRVRITRRGDLITLGGRLPRLSKKDPDARLAELRKMIGSLA